MSFLAVTNPWASARTTFSYVFVPYVADAEEVLTQCNTCSGNNMEWIDTLQELANVRGLIPEGDAGCYTMRASDKFAAKHPKLTKFTKSHFFIAATKYSTMENLTRCGYICRFKHGECIVKINFDLHGVKQC